MIKMIICIKKIQKYTNTNFCKTHYNQQIIEVNNQS